MTTPPTPYAWLDPAAVRDHLGANVIDDDRNADAIERARVAAAEFCERNRRDLVVDGAFTPGPDVVMAGVLIAARTYARKGAPLGTASYGEFAVTIDRVDIDAERMLGIGRYAKPACG